jgi:hypothetical protein
MRWYRRGCAIVFWIDGTLELADVTTIEHKHTYGMQVQISERFVVALLNGFSNLLWSLYRHCGKNVVTFKCLFNCYLDAACFFFCGDLSLPSQKSRWRPAPSHDTM